MGPSVSRASKTVRSLLALVLCYALLPVLPAAAVDPVAKTIYVDAVSGNDASDGLTATTAVEHIGAALLLSDDGDSIELASGTYADEEWPIAVQTGVTIRSAVDSGDGSDAVVIDGGFDSQIMSISADAAVALVGITFTGGAVGEGGGAIAVWDTALTVDACSFTDNLADRGSAIYAQSSTLTITESDFEFNGEETSGLPWSSAAVLPVEVICNEGGAIYASDCEVGISGSSFSANGAYEAGAAVFLGGCEAVIDDCTFSGNQGTSLTASGSSASGSASKGTSTVERLSAAAKTLNYDALSGDVSVLAESVASGGAITAIETYLDVTDSTFDQNFAFLGGAVWAPIAITNIMDCTFTDNLSLTGAVDLSSLGFMGPASAGYEIDALPKKVSGAAPMSSAIESCEFTGNWGLLGVVGLSANSLMTNSVLYDNGDVPESLVDEVPPEEPETPTLMSVVFAVDGLLDSVETDSMVGAQIMNTTIADNNASIGVLSAGSGATVANSIVWNGNGLGSLVGAIPIASDLETPPAELGSFSVQPSIVASWFSEEPEFVDPEGGDYRLAHVSPCIDAGIDLSDFLTTDFDDVTRPVDGDEDGTAAFDVGAFEYDPWLNTRLGGDDRYATSVAVSQQHFSEGADTVVLATGRKFADGLSAAGLAGVYEAPILLTDPLVLPEVVADEIVRLGASRVVIIGETMAVSEDVADSVAALDDITVDRIGGVDRYATAAEVAAEIIDELGDEYSGMYFVARGDLYADALTASPVAWSNKVPILLVEPGEMPDATIDAITAAGGGSAVIVGGAKAVGSDVEATVGKLADTVVRVTGTDRYDTSAKFSTWAVDGNLAAWAQVGIATGEQFPDALSGGAGVGTRNGVVLLTPKASMHASIADAISDNAEDIDSIEVFGGEAAVALSVYDAIIALVAGG